MLLTIRRSINEQIIPFFSRPAVSALRDKLINYSNFAMPARKIAKSSAPNPRPIKKGKEISEADGLLPPDPNAGPSRRSARQANRKWEADYADTAATATGTPTLSPKGIKQENNSPPKANTGLKRSVQASATSPGSAKRVKFDQDEDGSVKADYAENSLPSPEDTDSGSELSDVKSEPAEDSPSEAEQKPARKPRASPKKSSKVKAKPRKAKSDSSEPSTPKTKSEKSAASSADKAAALQAKKLKEYSQFSKQSPFPDFLHPTPDEARLAHKILAKIHGERVRPEKVVARSDRAGCGDSPSVLDALVRTILSQNTSDKNSTRAKRCMDEVYGGSDEWEKIAEGGQPKLQEAIKSGGLSVVKSKVIISILQQAKEKYGEYSLDHLFKKTDEEAMQELLAFQGVGPKTASCVLLFCLQRESFAVDTHVYRIAGLLGWRPQSASRDETHAHLEVRIPDEDKYGLHILMVGHGKKCDECKAGGKSTGKCELRRAFRKGKLQGEAGQEVKEDEEEVVKKEEDGEDDEIDVKDERGSGDDWEGGQHEYVHGMEGTKNKKNL